MDDGLFFQIFPSAGSCFFGIVAMCFVIVGAHIAWCLLTDED